jgi:hypothetical protein
LFYSPLAYVNQSPIDLTTNSSLLTKLRVKRMARRLTENIRKCSGGAKVKQLKGEE